MLLFGKTTSTQIDVLLEFRVLLQNFLFVAGSGKKKLASDDE